MPTTDARSPAPAHPCPCCGHLTLAQPPGSYDLCEVCSWEDDAIQLRWPTYRGGANRPSLIEAQRTYVRVGAMEQEFTELVRPARDDEPTNLHWRPIDLARDSFEACGARDAEWPDDLTVLYWRPTFWRSAGRLGHQ